MASSYTGAFDTETETEGTLDLKPRSVHLWRFYRPMWENYVTLGLFALQPMTPEDMVLRLSEADREFTERLRTGLLPPGWIAADGRPYPEHFKVLTRMFLDCFFMQHPVRLATDGEVAGSYGLEEYCPLYMREDYRFRGWHSIL